MDKLVFVIFICLCLYSCGSGNNASNNRDSFVEVADSDHSLQYYLVINPEKFVSGERFTTDDLKASCRLLLTTGGIVKGIDVNQGGYNKVISYRCEPDVAGWYCVTCWYLDKWGGEEKNITVYTRKSL